MDEETSIAWIDLLNLMLQGLILIMAVALVLMNPPQKNKSDPDKTPGALNVMITWPNDLDVDIDLWMKDPTGEIIGYSHKEGTYFNLIRDDLGKVNDVSGINFELATSRVILPGNYVFNLHYYSNHGTEPENKPVPVHLIITKRNEKGETSLVYEDNANVPTRGAQITVVRFVLGPDGYVVPGSISRRPENLRDAQ